MSTTGIVAQPAPWSVEEDEMYGTPLYRLIDADGNPIFPAVYLDSTEVPTLERIVSAINNHTALMDLAQEVADTCNDLATWRDAQRRRLYRIADAALAGAA